MNFSALTIKICAEVSQLFLIYSHVIESGEEANV